MKIYAVFLFMICLNIAAFILVEAEALPVSQTPEGYSNPSEMKDIFRIENVDLTKILTATVGGILAGIAGLLTRQSVYAAFAILIWVIGVFLTPIGWILAAFPLIISSLATMNGVPVAVGLMINGVLTAFYTFMFFMFIMEIAAQRAITT